MARLLTLLMLVAGGAGLLVVFVSFGHGFGRLPEVVPTHFDIAGNPDAWGRRSALVVFPITAAFVFGFLLMLAAGWPPTRPTLPPAVAVLASALCAEVVWMLAQMQSATYIIALGEARSLGAGLTGWFVAIGATSLALIAITIAISIRRGSRP